MSKTRIYVVQASSLNQGQDGRVFLVDASSRQQAERHVAAKFVAAEIADGKTIARLMGAGMTVEHARVDGDTETADLPGVS